MSDPDDDPRDNPFAAPSSASPGRATIGGPARAASRRARLLATALVVYPALLVGCLYATWLSAWALLGHPPRPSLDDPKDCGWPVNLLHATTWTLLLAFPLALVGSGGVYLAALVLEVRWGRRRPLLVLLPPIAWVVAFLLLRGDPGHVAVWFMD